MHVYFTACDVPVCPGNLHEGLEDALFLTLT